MKALWNIARKSYISIFLNPDKITLGNGDENSWINKFPELLPTEVTDNWALPMVYHWIYCGFQGFPKNYSNIVNSLVKKSFLRFWEAAVVQYSK